MREPPPPLTADDKIFLTRLRDDIVARSEFYLLGMDYLQLRLSVDRLYEADLAVWERKCVIYPTTPKPDRDSVDYCLSRRLIRVFSEMLSEGLSTPDDDLNPYDYSKAKAVLVLTWLLTDKETNRHPFGVGFGVWGATPEQRIALKGRAMARVATLDELNGSCRARWMELARQAWQVLMVPGERMMTQPQHSIGNDVSVERIWHLPILDEFKRVLIDAVSFVLAHPERFDDAAKAINAELEAKLRENAGDDGPLYSPSFWLTFMLPDAVEAGPPALGNGPDYEYAAWWQRVMLLTTLAVYPGDLSRFGMCGAIPWDHGIVYGPLGDDPQGVPVPEPGRAWMLFEIAETLRLRPEMQDEVGEHVEHRYGELVDGKRQDVVKRTPWQAPGVLRKLVNRLQPILRELGPLPDPLAVALIDAIDRWGNHNDEPPYVLDMLGKAIAACKAWGEGTGRLLLWRERLPCETPEWAYSFVKTLRNAAESGDPSSYLREIRMRHADNPDTHVVTREECEQEADKADTTERAGVHRRPSAEGGEGAALSAREEEGIPAAEGAAEGSEGQDMPTEPVASGATIDRSQRRAGRLNKSESEAKRASMMATLRQHPSLKNDIDKLAASVGISKSTAYRWLADEDRKYRESAVAGPRQTTRECEHCQDAIAGDEVCPDCGRELLSQCIDCHREKVHGQIPNN